MPEKNQQQSDRQGSFSDMDKDAQKYTGTTGTSDDDKKMKSDDTDTMKR
jgi:hypothetical protein